MRIIWTRRALGHLASLREYMGSDNPTAAQRVAERIMESVAILTQYPQIGRPGRVVGTRELVVPDTPYIVPYRVKLDRLELLAFLHGRQKWPKRF